ncbi:hypothetical protein OH492_26560 [Vibrio chagasii]|nr:hypothetical protein [Vibrio chagasii]
MDAKNSYAEAEKQRLSASVTADKTQANLVLAEERLNDLNSKTKSRMSKPAQSTQAKKVTMALTQESIVGTSIEAPELEHIDAWFAEKTANLKHMATDQTATG